MLHLVNILFLKVEIRKKKIKIIVAEPDNKFYPQMLNICIRYKRKPAVVFNAVNGAKKCANQSKCLLTKDSSGTQCPDFMFFLNRESSFVHTWIMYFA